MILLGSALAEKVQEAIDLPWLDRVIDALVRTWESVPLEQRWTLGTFVVVAIVSSKWVIPALATLVRAFRQRADRSGVFKRGPKDG